VFVLRRGRQYSGPHFRVLVPGGVLAAEGLRFRMRSTGRVITELHR
jgi:hypothetical protein